MFKMDFQLGNEYFVQGSSMAVAETLKAIAEKVLDGDTRGFIYDGNGNGVGSWECEYATLDEPEEDDELYNLIEDDTRFVWSELETEWIEFDRSRWDGVLGSYISK